MHSGIKNRPSWDDPIPITRDINIQIMKGGLGEFIGTLKFVEDCDQEGCQAEACDDGLCHWGNRPERIR